jgi:hypothetical protein
MESTTHADQVRLASGVAEDAPGLKRMTSQRSGTAGKMAVFDPLSESRREAVRASGSAQWTWMPGSSTASRLKAAPPSVGTLVAERMTLADTVMG